MSKCVNKYFLLFISLVLSSSVFAQETFTFEMDIENDLISLSSNVEDFVFGDTTNLAGDSEENVNNISYPLLENHMTSTVLIRIDGEVAGIATQIFRFVDEANMKTRAIWSLKFNYPGRVGFMAVELSKDITEVMSLFGEVVENPDEDWSDSWQMLRTSAEGSYVQFASGDLSEFQNGSFVEYSGVNQSDLRNFGRFRGKAMFTVYAAETTE